MSKPFNELAITFIGAGNMAEALIKGLLDQSVTTPDRISVVDLLPGRLNYMTETYGVTGSADPAAAGRADVVVMAVKPQQMNDVLRDLQPLLSQPLVISIAAGIPIARFEELLGAETRVIRVMPNTPALVGLGAAGIAGGGNCTEADLATADTFLSSVGVAIRVDEVALDAVTAASGSGPAYAFYLIESMLNAAEELGLTPEQAAAIVPITVEGAARMCRETGLPAAELRARVTSKGGTTAAALAHFEEAGVGNAIGEAMRAAHKRSKEL